MVSECASWWVALALDILGVSLTFTRSRGGGKGGSWTRKGPFWRRGRRQWSKQHISGKEWVLAQLQRSGGAEQGQQEAILCAGGQRRRNVPRLRGSDRRQHFPCTWVIKYVEKRGGERENGCQGGSRGAEAPAGTKREQGH